MPADLNLCATRPSHNTTAVDPLNARSRNWSVCILQRTRWIPRFTKLGQKLCSWRTSWKTRIAAWSGSYSIKHTACPVGTGFLKSILFVILKKSCRCMVCCGSRQKRTDFGVAVHQTCTVLVDDAEQDELREVRDENWKCGNFSEKAPQPTCIA